MSGATKIRGELQAGTSGNMDSSAMETEEYYNPEGGEWSQKMDTVQLCRVCANPNEYLIPIFEGEGLEHKLSLKIEKHLPIKVTETDTLPQHMCYQCASTLIAWHDLVISCVEADKKLKELQADEDDNDDDKGTEMFESHSMDSEPADEVDQPSTSETQSEMTAKLQVPRKTTTSKDKKPKLKMVLVKGGTSGQKTVAKSQVAKALELAKSKEGGNEDSASERSPDVKQETPTTLNDLQSLNIKSEHVYSIWIKADEDDKEYYLCDVKKMENNMQITKRSDQNQSDVPEEDPTNLYNENWSSQLPDHDYIQPIMNLHEDKGLSATFITPASDSETDIERCSPIYIMKCYKIGGRCHAKLVQVKQPVQCKHCFKSFSSEAVALTHLRSHTGFSPFYCKFCGRSFMLSSSLKQHINNCTYVSNYEVDFNTSHPLTKGNNERYICTICGKMYKLKPSLKDHLRAHFGKARRKQKCEICGEKFLTKAEIKEHLLSHDCHRFFTCSTCNKKFVLERDLIDHMISHTDERPYCCSLCGATYKRKSHLNRHVLSHQTDKKLLSPRVRKKPGPVFKCQYCLKDWPSARLLMLHEISHTGERNFECQVCGKRFAQSGALTRHVHVVHEGAKDFKCEICHQSFTAKATKQNHMRIHTGEKPYQCATCGKTFRTQQQHRIHERVHTDMRPYPCPYCEKCFRRRPHLIVHIRTHTGEKPYACPICGRCFAQKNDMTKHTNIHNRGTVPIVS